ncbi:MAG: parvulin peptidyl-prolyl isomerase [Desulfobacteraceae bacterium]|nr:parvulin peptidyl-prolyl isomerase [Desulfobacteraceae bacterium]
MKRKTNWCLTENPCLGEKLPICKAQEILKPECTTVYEDSKILKQRSRWVSFCSNTNWIIFSLIVISFSFCWSVSAEVIDRIVAIVNDDIVTLAELNKESGPYIKKIESSSYPDEKKKTMIQDINKQILDQLIDNSLTQQESKKYRITISDNEINKTIENIKKSRSLSQEAFDYALIQEGTTIEAYRENIKMQMIRSKIINFAVKSKVIVTESEIKKYYDANTEKYSGKNKYNLRNILANNEDVIKKIKMKLDKKASFASLAKSYSIAPNASDGGKLGIFDISNFPKSINDSLSIIKKGEYTNIISTAQGFQIFYIEDIVLDGSKTYEQAYDEIYESFYLERVEKKFKTWLESLKKKAHIKKML